MNPISIITFSGVTSPGKKSCAVAKISATLIGCALLSTSHQQITFTPEISWTTDGLEKTVFTIIICLRKD